MNKGGGSRLYDDSPVHLQGGAVATAEQLVGHDLRQLCAHLPATLHLLLSIQHAPQGGRMLPTYSCRPAQIRYQRQLM